MLGAVEHDLVQIGQPFAGAVVPGVAHQRIVVPRHALSQQERAVRDLGVQVVRRLEDLLRCHPAKVVRGQRRKVAIHPVLQERSVGVCEVEADREVIRRNVCRANQLKASRTIRKDRTEFVVEPELPGIVDVTGIIGCSIRPDQVWF